MNILLVEDNQADALLLTELLEDTEKAPVLHWVTDGHYALDYVYRRAPYQNAWQPDLILLDLGLPRLSGYEVLQELKKSACTVPVIVLSTSGNPEDTSRCLDLGARDYICKPRNLDGYTALVQRLMMLELPKTA